MISILVYDGSFEGFLSSVFYSYEYKLDSVDIQKQDAHTHNFFDAVVPIHTDEEKAKRLWSGLRKTGGNSSCKQVYTAFLSEEIGIENKLLYVIRQTFIAGTNVLKRYIDPNILSISKLCKMVQREKHRMDAFVRFKRTKDGYYFATVTPDFNVLPLNAKHFKNRYADQQWIIYDLSRNYGLFYDLNTVQTVMIQFTSNPHTSSTPTFQFHEEEHSFQELWKLYFDTTTIASRKNTKLHLQHVPKRYWKYLSEKQPKL